VRRLLAHVRGWAAERPAAPAVRDESGELDYRTLWQETERLAGALPGDRVGFLMDNGVPWAVVDLAIQQRGSLGVPMPGFFSTTQLEHLIRDADLDLVVTDRPERVARLLPGSPMRSTSVAGRGVWLFERGPQVAPQVPLVPPGTAKVTYTSGTTGTPKGVCLGGDGIEQVVVSLCGAVAATPGDRPLSLLPLSTLLENIGGLYAPLYVGACAQVPALATCGVDGSSGLRPGALFEALWQYAPTSLILVPQLLKVITEGVAAGLPRPSALRFVAVGGAPVSPALLERARGLGLPAYLGYGLSEAVSVVALSLPGADRPGSVGRPLPGVRVSVTAGGELVVHDRLFLGYLGGSAPPPEGWRTGDLGYLDAEGFLYLTGREKTAYATAFGRNVAPEWVESELTGHPLIAQAAVFGEARPFNVAVIVPRGPATPAEVGAAMRWVGSRLPDYARVGGWVLADEPFTAANGLATGAGSLRRDAIGARYHARIEAIYEEDRRAIL